MKRTFFTALAALFLTACAGPGAVHEIVVTAPSGKVATIVAHDQSVPDWMLDGEKLAVNYIVDAQVTDLQRTAVAAVEKSCRLYTGVVRPSNLVAIASQGVIYALAGGIGLGIGSHAFSGTVAAEYAKYGAAASGFGGAANGTVSIGGQTYTFENCGREMFSTKAFRDYEVKVLHKSPY